MKQRQIPWIQILLKKQWGLIALLVTSQLVACEKDKEEPNPECGCESNVVIGSLTNEKAQYVGEGIFIVYNPNIYEVQRLFTACDVSTSWKVSGSGVFDYTISGSYKEQCLGKDMSPPFVPNRPIDLTSIVQTK